MPTTIQAVLILILILGPGYVAHEFAMRTKAAGERGELRFLLRIVAFGGIVHALAFYWTQPVVSDFLRVWSSDQQLADMLSTNKVGLAARGVLVMLLIPIVVGTIVAAIRHPQVKWLDRQLHRFRLSHLSYTGRVPTAWEFLMAFPRSAWVKIYMDDDEVIGGVFSERSFASIDADEDDLYLEEQWVLDGDNEFYCRVPTSLGVWVPRSRIRFVEFLEGQDG